MRRLIVQFFIDSLAILAAVVLLSRIVVAQPFPFGGEGFSPVLTFEQSSYQLIELFITGAALTIFYSILRPLLVILTGRLLLWTLGAFQVVVIAIVLTFVSWLSPLALHLANPAWLWILVAALIVGGVRSALGAVLGLAGPPTGGDFSQRIWRYLDS